jgi:hypothetical protein
MNLKRSGMPQSTAGRFSVTGGCAMKLRGTTQDVHHGFSMALKRAVKLTPRG